MLWPLSIILGQAIGRWGNFINQEAYGYPVSSKFISHFPAFIQKQMYIENQFHHPTFLYESLWNLAVFTFLIYIFRRRQFNGQVMLLYLALYSVGRFFVESLRMDSEMLGLQVGPDNKHFVNRPGNISLYKIYPQKPAKHVEGMCRKLDNNITCDLNTCLVYNR
ncbi:MAG: prolipoprotein diacylglyceryl transferase [Candidatus Syntrophopropionicum ammoniitolerans]